MHWLLDEKTAHGCSGIRFGIGVGGVRGTYYYM